MPTHWFPDHSEYNMDDYAYDYVWRWDVSFKTGDHLKLETEKIFGGSPASLRALDVS